MNKYAQLVKTYLTEDPLLQQALTLEFQNLYRAVNSTTNTLTALDFVGGVTSQRAGNTYTLTVKDDSHSHSKYYQKSSYLHFTPEGGIVQLFRNGTGAASIRGTIVAPSTTQDSAVVLSPASSPSPIGVMYSHGVANNDYVWVVILGKAYVLLKDGVAATQGGWLSTSDTVGRANCVVTPPSSHVGHIGHSLEIAAAGTTVPVMAFLHFN